MVHRESDVIVFLIDALQFSVSQVVTLLICLTSIVL